MAQVVRQLGSRKRSKTVDGEEVIRVERIYLSSHNQWYPCLDTDNHFVYKSKRVGSTTLCTCGSPSVTVSYAQYKQYSSYMGLEVLACQSLIQRGHHADGST